MTRPSNLSVRLSRSDDPAAELLQEMHTLFAKAFGEGFDRDDWDHALGGQHILARDRDSGALVGHAAVIARELLVGGRPYPAGYVEAVSTDPEWQHRGVGRAVMTEVSDLLRSEYQLGALATGVHGFYRQLGWERWLGPTSAYDGDVVRITPDEDGAIMVLRFGASADLDLNLPISAPARSGADW